MIILSERERQASDYERLADMFDQCGDHVFAERWRERADELLNQELIEFLKERRG